MAEVAAVVGAAASAAGLLSLTVQVIQISQTYISGVRHASKTIRNYFRELEIMRLVLQDFQSFVDSKGGNCASYTALQACSEELEGLRSKLSKRMDSSTSANRFNRLTWPFAEDETKRLTEVLHRYQSSLHMLLTAQNHRLAISTLMAIEKVEALQEQGVKDRIVRWLQIGDPLVNHTAARDKHEPSTGDWFLNSDDFITWKSTPDTNMWIRSIAGAGKTILCSTIVDHLVHQQSAGDFILFYYFDFRNERKQKLTSLLLSLIAQICVRADSVPQNIEEAFHKGSLLDTRSLMEMFTALALDYGHVKIVVDALDESSEKPALLEFFETLANNFAGTVQWLVTSRNEQDIGAALTKCIPAIVSLNKTLVNEDIRLHVGSCLIRDPVLRGRPAWVKERISETLLSKADGMYAKLPQDRARFFLASCYYVSISDRFSHWFQYVVCQLSVLRGCLTGPAVEAALANLPTGIDETYDRMLLGISPDNWQKVRRALLIITFSMRPLQAEEVAEFAVISGKSKPFDPGERLFEPKDIIGLAAGLIVYDETNDSLILAHYSVQEYLLSSRITGGPAYYFALSELAAHQYITRASVLYMLSVADVTEGYHGITQDYPFLQYAAAYWVQHARPSLLSDAFHENIGLALQVLDGRNGAHKFWLTYNDAAGKNLTALESLCDNLHWQQLLAIVRHPGLLHLPSNVLVPELCFLFTHVSISNRSSISAQGIIDAKARILKIVRGLDHPSSKLFRRKMFSNLCLMDAGHASPNWEPLNEAMYLALFEPLDFTGLGTPPETFCMKEVELEGTELEHHTTALEAREPHENRFSHALKYIRERISKERIKQDVRKYLNAGGVPRSAASELEASPIESIG